MYSKLLFANYSEGICKAAKQFDTIGRKNLPITSGEKQSDFGQLAKKTDPRSHAMIVVDNDTLAHIRNELRETTEICNHAQCIAYPFE